MLPISNAQEIIIEEINIKAFGKLKDFKLNLGSGLNVVYGRNESGKSTVQLFIKAMFYGLPSRKKSGEYLKDRDRAIPWDNTFAEGSLRLKADNRCIEIYRRFGKTAAGDRLEVCDGVTGEKIPEYSDLSLGEALLGIPCEVFEKTLWVNRSGVAINGKSEELSAKLINLQTSGDEAVSAETALKALLREKRLLKAKDGRSAKGKIDVLTERREECRRQKYELATRLSQTEEINKRLGILKSEREEVDTEIKKLEKAFKESINAEKQTAILQRLKNIDECDRQLDLIYKNEDYIRAKDITEDDVQLARELEIKLDSFKQQTDNFDDTKLSKKSSAASAAIGGGAALSAAAFAAAIVLFILKAYAFAAGSVIILLAGILAIISGIRMSADCKNIKNETDRQNRQRQTEEKEIRERYEKSISKFKAADFKELSQLYIRIQGILEREKNLKEARQGFLGGDSYEALKEMTSSEKAEASIPSAEAETCLAEKRTRQLQLAAEIKGLESKMAYEVKITDMPADIKTELSAIDDEIKDCNRRLDAIELAEQAIAEASETFRQGFTPMLSKRVDEIIAYLTDGKYGGVKIAEDYRIRLQAEHGLYDAEYFSKGMYEQLYFALRVAVAELICSGLPMFFDDILTVYDNQRTILALNLLREITKQRQAIVFTCHLRDKENAQKVKADIINL